MNGSKTGLAAFFCVTLLGACEAREEPFAQDAPAPIASLRSACNAMVFEEAAFTHCIAEPENHAIRMVLGNDEGQNFASLAAYAAARPAGAPPVVFAMNGGGFDEGGTPHGYYVEKGDRLFRLNRSSDAFGAAPSAVLYGFVDSGWFVWESQRFYDEVTRRPDFGTQSGPMLVQAGEINLAITEMEPVLVVRNAVGRDAGGRLHFVISDQPVDLARLARFFRDVANTPNAMQLDENVAQLWDPQHDRLDLGDPLGPIIVVEMRENPQ